MRTTELESIFIGMAAEIASGRFLRSVKQEDIELQVKIVMVGRI